LGLARLRLDVGGTRKAEAVLGKTQNEVLQLRRLRKDRQKPPLPPDHRRAVPARDDAAESAG
jgi:hypothetical protein